MVSRVASLAQELNGAGGRFAWQAMCRAQTVLHLPGKESWHLADKQAASGGEGVIFLLDSSFHILA